MERANHRKNEGQEKCLSNTAFNANGLTLMYKKEKLKIILFKGRARDIFK